MQFEAEVCLVVIKEDGPGKYSILLCDPHGSAQWCAPFGEVLDVENEEEFLQDPDEIFPVLCLHHLNRMTDLDDESLDDGEILKYSFHRIPATSESLSRIVFSYWTMIDKDREKIVAKALKKKKGNVAFFPYAPLGEVGLPEMMDPMQRYIIDQVMSHFNQRDN